MNSFHLFQRVSSFGRSPSFLFLSFLLSKFPSLSESIFIRTLLGSRDCWVGNCFHLFQRVSSFGLTIEELLELADIARFPSLSESIFIRTYFPNLFWGGNSPPGFHLFQRVSSFGRRNIMYLCRGICYMRFHLFQRVSSFGLSGKRGS